MDFVKGLPKSQSKDVVLVVVDRLTKFVHFVPLSHPYIATKVATHLPAICVQVTWNASLNCE